MRVEVRCTMCGWKGKYNDLKFIPEPDYDSGGLYEFVPHCPRCFSENGIVELEE